MANVTYTSDGKALEYTLPDGYKADFIALIPRGASGKITLVNGTDYTVSHGVIRFFRVPPEGASIVISNEINNLVSLDAALSIEGDLRNEVQARKALSAVVDGIDSRTSQNEQDIDALVQAYRFVVDEGNISVYSFDGLNEASLSNTLMLADIYSRIRTMEHPS